MDKSVQTNNRASKKQQELYDYVANFITENGYGPSYREIMAALGYKSVSTVAVHVDGLINKGYLKKLDGSARTLAIATNEINKELQQHYQWLIEETTKRLNNIDENSKPEEIADAEILLNSLRIFGMKKEYEELLLKRAK